MEPVSDSGAHIVETTALGSCLIPLLKALGWHGTRRQLTESMPHYSQIYNPAMFRDVMKRLAYSGNVVRTNLQKLDDRLLPCLFVAENGSVMVVLKKENSHYVIFDGEMNSETTHSISDGEAPLEGIAYVFKKRTAREKKLIIEDSWIRRTFLENKKLIYSAIVLSFFINILALATPLFIMATYDKVVGTGSRSMLGQFLIGVVLAYIGYYILYRIRSKLLAVVGARFDRAIGNNIFERLLYLAPIYTESATVGSQVARIKDFDRLREFLTGPMVIIFFDLPFIFISLIIIAIIGGNLVIIPALMLLAYFIIGLVMRIKVKRRIAETSLCGAQQQEFMLEAVKSVRALKYTLSEKRWEDRFRDYSASVSMANLKITILSAINSAIADVIMIVSGMAVLAA